MKGIGGLVERGTCRLREALAGRLGSGPLARGEAASRGRLVGPAIPFEGQSSCPMMRSRERERPTPQDHEGEGDDQVDPVQLIPGPLAASGPRSAPRPVP
jgi:hypothetical protein